MTYTKSVSEIIQDLVQTQKPVDEQVEAQEQIVVFKLDNEEYGVKITDLKEIIKTPVITIIPNAPNYVKGILNLKGIIVVVIDLEKRLQLTNSTDTKEKKHILIAELDKNTFGIEIDQVLEILSVPLSKIQKSPDTLTSKAQKSYVKGVLVINSRLIMILDLPALLKEADISPNIKPL